MTQLSDAVSAINLYPAGLPALTCSLANLSVSPTLTSSSSLSTLSSTSSTSSSTQASTSGNPSYDYAVGGGRSAMVARCNQQGRFEDNFSLNARVDPAQVHIDGAASGHFNLTLPPGCHSTYTDMTYGSASHLVADVHCLRMGGEDSSNQSSVAEFVATVTQKTGLFANPDEFPYLTNGSLTQIAVGVYDSGTSNGDTISWDGGTTSGACDIDVFLPEPFDPTSAEPVDSGNINVHLAP